MIVHFTKCTETTTIASARIARFLAEQFEMPLVDSCESLEEHLPSAKEVIFVNSPSAFCPFRDDMDRIIKDRRLIWVLNDYTIYPPTQLRDALGMRKMETWSILSVLPWSHRWTFRNLEVTETINWNELTYDLLDRVEASEEGLVYWGACRQFREGFFRKWLDSDLYDVAISSSNPGRAKFAAICPNATLYMPFTNVASMIRNWRATIYLEDPLERGNGCPANRFYESLSAGIGMFFDEVSIPTFREHGINIKPYVVHNQQELAHAIKMGDSIGKEQRAKWNVNASSLRSSVRTALERARSRWSSESSTSTVSQ